MKIIIEEKETELTQVQVQGLIDLQNKTLKSYEIKMSKQSRLIKKMELKLKDYIAKIESLS
ncbi:MAG: hypothetical protein GY804_06865 [Alphaproteobacteria bacterium]|nr:hypothetical protein [Alphaproteobacteria bacterium]